MLQGDAMLGALRRELRKLSPGIRITQDELGALLRAEVFKRDVLEGEKADSATKLVRRGIRRRERAQEATAAMAEPAVIAGAP